jgi:hypothetical protein
LQVVGHLVCLVRSGDGGRMHKKRRYCKLFLVFFRE